MGKPDLLKPTLVAGLVFGFLAAVPGVNCCCCLWWALAGWLATYLFSREAARTGYPVRLADGALLGLIAGLFGGFTTTIFDLLVNALFGDMMREWGQGMLNSMPRDEGSGPLIDSLQQAFQDGGQAGIVGMIFKLFLNLFFFSLFSTVGGVLTALFLGRAGGAGTPGQTGGPGGGPTQRHPASPMPGGVLPGVPGGEQPVAFGPGAPPPVPPRGPDDPHS